MVSVGFKCLIRVGLFLRKRPFYIFVISKFHDEDADQFIFTNAAFRSTMEKLLNNDISISPELKTRVESYMDITGNVDFDTKLRTHIGLSSDLSFSGIRDRISCIEESGKGTVYSREEKTLVVNEKNFQAEMGFMVNKLRKVIPVGIAGDVLSAFLEVLMEASFDSVRQELETNKFEFKVLQKEADDSYAIYITKFTGKQIDDTVHLVKRFFGFGSVNIACEYLSCLVGIRTNSPLLSGSK